MKKNLTILLIIGLMVFFNACRKSESGIVPQQGKDSSFVYPKKQMRAVWMATVYGLDWPDGQLNAAAQKQKYIDYLNLFQQLNINTVFVQVKGMGDAFYNSPYEPWSAAITGTRGTDPGYDVLKFMIDEAHARNIEFHAWLNPYRIATRASSATAYPVLHPSVKPEWVVSHEKIQIYNPAVPEVRQRLADIVKDIITKYNVDGIHFDDYFYPDPSAAGTMVADKPDYDKYGADIKSVEEFRRDNVDKAIKGVYDAIVATKPEIVFSVSPTPGENYNLNTLYADVQKWAREGWVDVLIPQLYQQIGAANNDYKERLQWWHQFRYQAMVMAGHALYRFGDGTSPTAFQSTVELEKQLALTEKYKSVLGNVLYSAKYLTLNKIGITDKLAQLWSTPSVIPFLGRAVAPAPQEATNIRVEGNLLKWTTSGNLRSVVYYFADSTQKGKVLAVTSAQEWPAMNPGYYSVSTLNADNAESKPSKAISR